jgi:hypothetical protein
VPASKPYLHKKNSKGIFRNWVLAVQFMGKIFPKAGKEKHIFGKKLRTVCNNYNM